MLMASAAWPTVDPVRRARCSAAERDPDARHRPVLATRAAASRGGVFEELLAVGSRVQGGVEVGRIVLHRATQLG